MFICEACTVRAVLQRELGNPGDRWLLKLERMRLLDVAHQWSAGTTRNYQTHLKKIKQFESLHPGLCIFSPDDFLDKVDSLIFLFSHPPTHETRPEPTGPHRPVYPLFNRFTSWRNGFSGALILRRTDDS